MITLVPLLLCVTCVQQLIYVHYLHSQTIVSLLTCVLNFAYLVASVFNVLRGISAERKKILKREKLVVKRDILAITKEDTFWLMHSKLN